MSALFSSFFPISLSSRLWGFYPSSIWFLIFHNNKSIKSILYIFDNSFQNLL